MASSHFYSNQKKRIISCWDLKKKKSTPKITSCIKSPNHLGLLFSFSQHPWGCSLQKRGGFSSRTPGSLPWDALGQWSFSEAAAKMPPWYNQRHGAYMAPANSWALCWKAATPGGCCRRGAISFAEQTSTSPFCARLPPAKALNAASIGLQHYSPWLESPFLAEKGK